MSRYFTKAAVIVTPDPEGGGYDLDCSHNQSSVTVHEDDLETWTGLLDARGMEIHRCERIALGFHKRHTEQHLRTQRTGG